MKLLLIALLLLPLTIVGQSSLFVLKGKITLIEPDSWGRVRLTYISDGRKIEKDTEIKDGKFEFVGTIRRVTEATLVLVTKRNVSSSTLDDITFYIEPGTMEMIGSEGYMSGASFVSGFVNLEYQGLKRQVKPIRDMQDSLFHRYTITPYDVRRRVSFLESIDSEYAKTRSDEKKLYFDFAINQPNSLIGLEALKRYTNGYPDPKADSVFKLFPPAVKYSLEGVEFGELLAVWRKTGVGSKAPDFTQKDAAGKRVKLSDFRGKYVLLDFWATWCWGCKENHEFLKTVYKQYGNKPFLILGIGLDQERDKQDWVDMIRKDSLTWTQVTDFQYWNNAAAKLYGIRAVPQNILIDPKGIIIGRNLSGNELGQRLAELLK